MNPPGFTPRFDEAAHLPQLAWHADVSFRDGDLRVLHGSGVETRGQSFFEAAWNGPFDAFDPRASSILSGSGGLVDGDHAVFASGTDRFSPIFSLEKNGHLRVSNSPVFILSMAGEAPDECRPFYSYQFTHIYRMGLRCPSGKIRLSSGRHLRVHLAGLVSVDRRGRIRFPSRPTGEKPRDFASYRSILREGVRCVLENAADPARKFPFRPLAAITGGYDSTATAALAAEAGCKEAFSFIDPRRPDPLYDSGKKNAERLGMTCAEYSRWEYLGLPGMPELEFALTTGAAQTPLAALGTALEKTILVSGHRGDALWNPMTAQYSDFMATHWVRYTLGLTDTEFRIRRGFLNLSPATFSCGFNREIARIGRSEEMAPWSVGGNYDRPLARRIAEEAGLPRESFGMKKQAGGHSQLNRDGTFTPAGLEDYTRFVRERDARENPLVLRYWKWCVHVRHFLWDRFSLKKRCYRPWSARLRYIPYLFHTAHMQIPWKFQFTFQWMFHSLKHRYRDPADEPITDSPLPRHPGSPKG